MDHCLIVNIGSLPFLKDSSCFECNSFEDSTVYFIFQLIKEQAAFIVLLQKQQACFTI
jgi:hypothetical protein